MSYAELPDAEITRLCATQVMSWAVRTGPSGNEMAILPDDSRVCLKHVYGLQPAHLWNPLESDADAFMLVDAIHAQGKLWFRLTTRWDKVNWSAGWTEQDFTGWNGHMDIEETNPGRRRAICLAALKATEATNA